MEHEDCKHSCFKPVWLKKQPKERLVHWFVWSAGVAYCMYRFALVSEELCPKLYADDFEDGWSFLGRKMDVSDLEWQTMKKSFARYGLWFLGYIILSQIFILRCPKLRPLFHACYSLLCICHVLGYEAMLSCILLIFIMFIVHLFGNSLLCIAIMIFIMLSFIHPDIITLREMLVSGPDKRILLEVALMWLNARTLSFAIDQINAGQNRAYDAKSILKFLGYCFYLPVFFTGPLFSFEDYSKQVENHNMSLCSPTNLRTYITKLIRLVIAFILLEVFLHFIYSTAVQYYIEYVVHFNAWELCGLGYALPCQFYLKYLVIYGFAGLVAEIEHIQLPPPPRCISREHLCSRLWRYFDRGLHLWITKYIYKPFIRNDWRVRRKLAACAICFTFVCLWHGMDKAICMWSFLNFIGVSLEMGGAMIASTSYFTKIKEQISPNMYRRLCALVATPLFLLMCVSCLFFLSNWEVGIYTFDRFISGFPVPLLPTMFFMYCGSQVSLDVREWEECQHKKSKKP